LVEEEVLYLPKIPKLHRDPFDRMLICQAIVNGLSIVTPDLLISQYPIRVLW
jgi:PIN domain nuclease of toxin-antitoxin system